VPDDWEKINPQRFEGPTEGSQPVVAEVLERFLSAPGQLDDAVTEMETMLPEMLDGYEAVAVEEVSVAGGEGRLLRYRWDGERGTPVDERRLMAASGPYLCELTLTAPREAPAGVSSLLDEIVRSVELHGTSFLASSRAMPLVRLDREASAGRAVAQQFPAACVALPVPEGWAASESGGDVLLENGDARITLHREVDADGSTDEWLRRWIDELQKADQPLLASESGELDDDRELAAILFEEEGQMGTWQRGQSIRHLHAVVDDQQPLIWKLQCPADRFAEAQETLSQVMGGARFLEPEEWQLPLAEDWVDLTLRGPWRSEGPGLYVQIKDDGSFALLFLSSLEQRLSLDSMVPSLVEESRRSFAQVTAEEPARGVWQGHDSFRFSADGYNDEGEPLSMRTVWITTNKAMYSAVLQSSDRSRGDALFVELLRSLQLERR
jgi:hypothetical protein